MHADSPAVLWDALHAGRLVQRFVGETTFDLHDTDDLLRSAVERQLGIVGEALNKLAKVDPETASAIAELPRIVGFRNVSCTATPPSTIASSGGSSKTTCLRCLIGSRVCCRQRTSADRRWSGPDRARGLASSPPSRRLGRGGPLGLPSISQLDLGTERRSLATGSELAELPSELAGKSPSP